MNPMNLLMVSYTVKPERIEENEQLIRAVYDELHQVRPAGLRYAAFRVDGGPRFVHLAMVDPGVEPHPLASRAAFQAYTAGIDDRCDEPPVAVRLDEVGSWEFGLR